MTTRFAAPMLALATAASLSDPAIAQSSREYALDDGTGFTESSLAQYDARVTWGNVFRADDKFSTISAVRVSFGSDTQQGQAFQIGIWDTRTADPTTGTLVGLSDHTINGPFGPESFLEVTIPQADVSGWFFVGIIIDLAQDEQGMRQDFSTRGTHSWRFDNGIGEDNFDLASAGFGGNLGDFGLGTWMVRAVAVPSPSAAAVLALGCACGARRRRDG